MPPLMLYNLLGKVLSMLHVLSLSIYVHKCVLSVSLLYESSSKLKQYLVCGIPYSLIQIFLSVHCENA
jgi:hypothetical protein